MSFEWPRVKLGDHVDSCLGKMLDKKKNKGKEQPYLGNTNVRWGEFDLSNLAQMKFEDNEHNRYGINSGDLIICEGGEPGRCAIWKDELPDMKIQKALHRVRTKPSLNNHYLYYWFLHAGKHGLLEPFFTGTTIKHLTGKALNALEIPLPPLSHQEYMAKILGGLDDKIQLNHQINQTLEQMAQAIFKSWFVDFEPVKAKIAALEAGGSDEDALLAAMQAISGKDEAQLTRLQAEQPEQYAELRATAELFPSAMQDCELGEIPEGWRAAPLNSVCEQTLGGQWGSDSEEDGLIAAACLRGCDMADIQHTGFANEAPVRFLKPNAVLKRQLEETDLLIASSGAGPCGRPLWCSPHLSEANYTVPVLYSNFVKRLRFDSRNLSIYFETLLYGMYKSGSISDFINGTSVPNLDIKGLLANNFIIPEDTALNAFAHYYLLARKSKESHESRRLASLRDTLLPKLLSGEISVPSAEHQLTESSDAANV